MKHVSGTLLAIVLLFKIVSSDKTQNNENGEIEARTRNELTPEELFVKSWGNFIGLWVYLFGIFILPTFITMAISPVMGRQARGFQDAYHQPADVMTKIRLLYDISQRLNIKTPECQKRFVCEVYYGKINVGLTAQDVTPAMFKLLPRYYRQLVNEIRKTTTRIEDCNYFTTCSHSLAEQLRII